MKAFFIKKFDKNTPLQFGELPEPVLRENDVLIEMKAASLNPIDFKVKHGDMKVILDYKFPLILGNDGAGIVAKIGATVKNFKVGDAVYFRPDKKSGIGTLAEFFALDENDVALKPNNLTMEQAASIPLVGLTSWQIFERAGLKKGQKVFIQAGSGGIGTFAIQLAKHLGATVATTASPTNFQMLKDLGADILIDYKTQKFEEILQDYDLVLNTQDEETLIRSMKILKKGGKIISISAPPDPKFAEENNMNWIMKLGVRFMSSKVRRQAKKYGVDYSFLLMHSSKTQLEQITKLIEAGTIKPVMDKIYPFEETNKAFEHIESGHAKGKVVIKIK